MPNFFEIPLSPVAQTFSVTLSGATYQLTTQWRDMAGWVLDIADASGNSIVAGIPLVTGTDLLGQYGHLGFAGRLWVQTTDDPDAVPTVDNLGTGSHLYWVTD